jgi:hypothetical protein
MWDAKVMWNYYLKKEIGVSEWKALCRRALCLLHLNLAARTKVFQRIARSSIVVDKEGVKFQFYGWKTQRFEKTKLSKPVRVKFMDNEGVCPARALDAYITSNKNLYQTPEGLAHDNVWIWCNKPTPVKTQTLAADARAVMENCGINTSVFKPASLRHAAISFWKTMGLSREQIAEQTMHRSLNVISFYYDKAVESKDIMKDLEGKLWVNGAFDDEESEEEFDGEDGASAQQDGSKSHQ